MNTQAHKLSYVLKYYDLSVISDNDYLERFRIGKEDRTLYRLTAKNPDLDDCDTVEQFTDNPFTLIDLVFNELINKTTI